MPDTGLGPVPGSPLTYSHGLSRLVLSFHLQKDGVTGHTDWKWRSLDLNPNLCGFRAQESRKDLPGWGCGICRCPKESDTTEQLHFDFSLS